MARSSIRTTGRSLTGIALRGLAVALGTVALVLLGYSTATAATPDHESGTSSDTSSLTGLVDDLTGSTLSPLTDVLVPVTDPVDEVVAPLVEPVRSTLQPVTRPVGDVVRDVATPSASAPTTPEAPRTDDADRAEATVVQSGSPSRDVGRTDLVASGSAARDDATTGSRPSTLSAARAEPTAAAADDDATGSGSSSDRQVDVSDLDFGPGSPLLAAWAVADHGAVSAVGFVGPMPRGTHVGADDSLVAVLGSTDHNRDSQSSTRPDVSPG